MTNHRKTQWSLLLCGWPRPATEIQCVGLNAALLQVNEHVTAWPAGAELTFIKLFLWINESQILFIRFIYCTAFIVFNNVCHFHGSRLSWIVFLFFICCYITSCFCFIITMAIMFQAFLKSQRETFLSVKGSKGSHIIHIVRKPFSRPNRWVNSSLVTEVTVQWQVEVMSECRDRNGTGRILKHEMKFDTSRVHEFFCTAGVFGQEEQVWSDRWGHAHWHTAHTHTWMLECTQSSTLHLDVSFHSCVISITPNNFTLRYLRTQI